MDEKLGLNFIECEENSEGEVSALPAESTERNAFAPAASTHADAAARWRACGGVVQRHLKSAIEVLRTNHCLGRYLSIVQEALNSVGILWASRGDHKVRPGWALPSSW